MLTAETDTIYIKIFIIFMNSYVNHNAVAAPKECPVNKIFLTPF